MTEVSVVIPNWNGKRFLETCLRSLEAQDFRNFDVVLVDNGSVDDSIRFVKSAFPSVRVIRFPENRGFSAAVNAGIAGSDGEFLFVLNNDTELVPGCLGAMVRRIREAPDIASVEAKILDFEDRGLLAGVGDGFTFCGMPTSIGQRERDQGQYDDPAEIFSPCAAAALYRRSALDQVGGFDEDFFAYFEDVDLGFRLQMAGFRCMYAPDATVYHVGGGSTGGALNPFTIRQMAQNHINLLVKNLPGGLLVQTALFSIALHAVLLCRTALFQSGKRGAHLAAYMKGFHGALVLLPRMVRKRRGIVGKARLSPVELRRRIAESERRIIASLFRSRGEGWIWAPYARFYLRHVSSRLG